MACDSARYDQGHRVLGGGEGTSTQVCSSISAIHITVALASEPQHLAISPGVSLWCDKILNYQ